MPIVYFREWNGEAPGDPTSKDGEAIQFKSSDDSTVEDLETATNPLTKPNAGVNRSCEKYLRLYLEDLEGMTSISNLQAYVGGTPPANGMGIFYKTSDEYTDPLLGGFGAGGAMVAPKTDFFTRDADNPIELGDGPFEDVLDDVGDFIIMQAELYPSVAVGDYGGRFTIYFGWDENV